MSKSSKSLNDLLHEIRRIEESREVLTKKKIRAIYKQLLKELTAFVAETYTKYSDENGTLTVAGLQRSAKLAWFLNEIDKNCNEYLPDVSKEIQKLIDTVYEECYIGMVEAVNRSYDLSALNVRPEVMKSAIANNVEKLTLPALLEKNRKEIVYEIKQTISIGLMNGERYETMSRKLVDRLDFSYGKANNVVRTETHRNIEAGLMDGAMETQKALFGSGLIHTATWHTMEDERVRPQHRYHTKKGWKTKVSGKANHMKMEGVTIIVGDKFQLEPNVYAPCPGMSGTARNDCNCRCFLEYDLLTLEEWGALLNKQENFMSAKSLDKSGKNDIIETREYDFLSGVSGVENISEQEAKMLDEIVSVIPEKHLSVIENTVQKVSVVPNRGYCSYDFVSKELILDPDKMNGSIIHEYGHVLADAYNIYNDKKFLGILKNKFDSLDWKNTVYFKIPAENDYAYFLQSDKLMDAYQGRIYVNFIGVDFTEPISLKCFQEYFSVGFNAYFNNPKLLENKDPELYQYIQELMFYE